MAEICSPATRFKDINLANHMAAIEYAALGPADPREPNTVYWMAKSEIWEVPEGTARTRLCMNCAHYKNDPDTLECVASGPGGQLKPSELPVTPRWADIEGMPGAVCTLWGITCSALRTCNDWEDPNLDEDNANVWFRDIDQYKEAIDWEEEPEEVYIVEEPEDEEVPGYKSIKGAQTYKPTSGMASAARRALKWKEEGKSGGTRVGLARANQLVRRENLTESTVMRMYSFFSRHEVDKKATGFNSGEEGFPSAGRVAWDLWGGDGGYSWSKSKRDQIMRRRENG